MPPPDFGARANFSHISIENTTLAIQQIKRHSREYFDSEKSASEDFNLGVDVGNECTFLESVHVQVGDHISAPIT